MFNVNLGTVITQMMEKLLPRFSDEQQGYMVSFEVEVIEPPRDDVDYDDRKSERIRQHLLFRRASNYMDVWHAEKSGLFVSNPEGLEWKHMSSHDSCWRQDGVERVVNRLYFDMCKNVDPDIAPAKMDNFLWGFDVQEVVVGTHRGERYNGEDLYIVDDVSLATD